MIGRNREGGRRVEIFWVSEQHSHYESCCGYSKEKATRSLRYYKRTDEWNSSILLSLTNHVWYPTLHSACQYLELKWICITQFDFQHNVFIRITYLFMNDFTRVNLDFFTQLIVENFTIPTLSIVYEFLFGIEIFIWFCLIMLYYSKYQRLSKKTKYCLL